MYSGLAMTDRTEKEPKFRRAMYLMILALLVGYIGLKSWHISVAFEAWENQPLDGSLTGAAKK